MSKPLIDDSQLQVDPICSERSRRTCFLKKRNLSTEGMAGDVRRNNCLNPVRVVCTWRTNVVACRQDSS